MKVGDEAWGMGHEGWDLDPDVMHTSEPGAIRSYEDLRVWQAGIGFAEQIYQATKSFPESELYGLTSQLRRAAVSVPSNIAEGYGRGSRGDYLRFLRMARGSLFEIQTQLIIAQRVGFLSEAGLGGLRQVGDGLRRQLLAMIVAIERNGSA